MKKRIMMLMAMAAVMMAVPAQAEEAVTEEAVTEEAQQTVEEAAMLENWAYAGLALNSEEAGVGIIYYTKEYFESEGRINPVTVEPYTEAELTAISEGAVFGAEGYVSNVPAGALVGMEIVGTESCIYWYDAENTANIVSSADPLALDAQTGEMMNGEGEAAAAAMSALEGWAYGALTMNNTDLGVGTIYYAGSYFAVEDGADITIVNPITVAPYTMAEINVIISGAVEGNSQYLSDIPEGAVIGISAPESETIVWFDDENAAAIVSSADALIVDVAAGEVKDQAGEVVATAMAG